MSAPIPARESPGDHLFRLVRFFGEDGLHGSPILQEIFPSNLEKFMSHTDELETQNPDLEDIADELETQNPDLEDIAEAPEPEAASE